LKYSLTKLFFDRVAHNYVTIWCFSAGLEESLSLTNANSRHSK